jgi:hypothetical protein
MRVVDGIWADGIDFAMLHKIYAGKEGDVPERHDGPATCTGVDVRIISSDPDRSRISTSYVERQNPTMRMGMCRFTRLTNGFSKKIEFHAHAVSLNFMNYNFARSHQSLRVRRPNGTYANRTPPWRQRSPRTFGQFRTSPR